ncbi:general substrate transporter [Emericellopsis atlantica]|uniref:General substrate transporter n=1 Tax=Emericellopsis atlantica TaxID=2614577 RepID=A0A9P7ZJE2_9HYPO|nr:general substrate transporter [Emericellopsis atlantica]KAG9252710.1 general substrate transporter [Emericellopsis atlantica]
MALPSKVYQVLVGVFAALGSFLYGYDLTIVAEVVASQSFNRKFNPSVDEIGLVASLLTAGAFVGAGLAATTSDFLGRRVTIGTGGLVFCLGGALQTGAENYSYVIGGRFISGCGVGILTMIIPLYQAELAHPDIRGLVTGLQQFMLGVGGVCGAWISYGTYVGFDDDRQWRIPFGLQIVPAALLAGLIVFFPESPRWLIKKGRTEDGLRTLARLHSGGNTEDAWVIAEHQQIQDSVAHESEVEAKSYTELFRDRANFRRVVIACAIQAATQMTGISAIQYYSVTIFAQVGITGEDTLRYQAINSVIGLISEVLIMLLVDKTGRRTIIIAGSLLMSLTYIISTVLMAMFPASAHSTGAHWGFIIMTWLFNFCFSSMGSLSWIIPAEMFDTQTRAKGVALATMTSFAFNTMIGQVTPLGMANVGWRFYILFVVTNITNALFFWSFLPETGKVPLEEMRRLFSESPLFIGSRDTSQYVNHDVSHLAHQLDEKHQATTVE